MSLLFFKSVIFFQGNETGNEFVTDLRMYVA